MILITPVIALVLGGTYGIGVAAFRRTECARIVFEAVHRAVHNANPDEFRSGRAVLRQSENGIEGRLKCGEHIETLFLPELENRNPGA
jgi:hypothetical protein